MENSDAEFAGSESGRSPEHWRGVSGAKVILTGYGDYQCPRCRTANRIVGKLLEDAETLRLKFIFRHFPMKQIHPQAEKAAEAAEAAGAQGSFWAMHDTLFNHQRKLADADLVQYAADLNLDVASFLRSLNERRYSSKIQADLKAGIEAEVCGTPTFFINDKIYEAFPDLEMFRREILRQIENVTD